MKLNLGSGRFPLDGFENLNEPGTPWPAIAWRAEDGLPGYADDSVEGVTVSHLLMYVPLERWLRLFQEIARVLAPGGVARVTEDATDDPASSRQGIQPGACTATSFELVAAYFHAAGLVPYWVPPNASAAGDGSLIQAWHGAPPDVFHVEAMK